MQASRWESAVENTIPQIKMIASFPGALIAHPSPSPTQRRVCSPASWLPRRSQEDVMHEECTPLARCSHARVSQRKVLRNRERLNCDYFSVQQSRLSTQA